MNDFEKRCLNDSGMPNDMICRYDMCMRNGQYDSAKNIIKKWRMQLLDRLHICQHQIDCLNYLSQNKNHKEDFYNGK